MLVFSVLLLMMVGAVFVYSPAIILDGICNSGSFVGGKMFWIILIFIYYIMLRFCLSTRLSERYILSLPSRCFSCRCVDDRTVHQVANLA